MRSLSILGGLVFLFLTACSPQSHQNNLVASAKTGIVDGTAVDAQNPMSFSTVQIIHPVVTKDRSGHTFVDRMSTCTGTIVATDIILTAGHCSAKNPQELILVFSNEVPGDLKEFFGTLAHNSQVRHVVAGVSAPNWEHLSKDESVNWGDISLLRFAGGLPEGYVPAQLAPADMTLTPNEGITLAGFGETDGVKQTQATQLMEVNVDIVDPNYSETEMLIDNVAGKGACHGDSGGPAYVVSEGKMYLAGVTSRADIKSDPQAVCVGKTIYTKVQSYKDWMSSEIQKLDSDSSYGTVIAEPPGF